MLVRGRRGSRCAKTQQRARASPRLSLFNGMGMRFALFKAWSLQRASSRSNIESSGVNPVPGDQVPDGTSPVSRHACR